jgi:hypothetical protein
MARAAGHRVSGSDLPKRVCAESAGRRACGAVSGGAGFPIPSAAVVNRMGRFRDGSAGSPTATGSRWCASQGRPQDRRYERAPGPEGRHGGHVVAAIGVARRSFNWWPPAPCGRPDTAAPAHRVGSGRAAGSCLLLPVDRDFGPNVKICTYFPNHIKVAQRVRMGRAAGRQGGRLFTELGNRFAACDDPPRCRQSVTGSSGARSRCSPNGG